MTVWLVSDNDNVGPAMSEKRAHLALLIDTLSAARLTEALRRVAGPEYLASTCADVFAIVRIRGNRRESVKGTSWSDVLNKGKRKWEWDSRPKREASHG